MMVAFEAGTRRRSSRRDTRRRLGPLHALIACVALVTSPQTAFGQALPEELFPPPDSDAADLAAPLATRVAMAPPPATQAEPINGYADACPPVALPPIFGPPPGSSFLPSLGRFGPGVPVAPGTVSSHAPAWELMPTPDPKQPPHVPAQHDCLSNDAEYRELDFSPDPWLDCQSWDGCSEFGAYGGKHLNQTQRPWVECFTPLYESGPWPPSYDCLGPTNLVRPKFYVFGDFRTAFANNNNVGNAQGVWANRLNLDVDFWLTATERFHMFWGPLDEGQQFTGLIFDDSRIDVDDHFDGFDGNTDTMFVEGDLGYIVGGLTGRDAPFDLPFTAGLVPLVFQNGIWLEDAFIGAATTLPAKNSPELDWSNFDTTFFMGFDELTTRAFNGDDDAVFVGATTFIERRGGYIEAGWAYVHDPNTQGLSYHNVGLSYTRRYLNTVSNSMRAIINIGQDGAESERTADGALLIMENSLISRMPYNVIPYLNLWAGIDRPQPLGRLQGPLKNTGINFESDLLTGYPILDDTANDTLGGALGVDLLGGAFDRQLIVEAATVQPFDDAKFAAGDQYAVGVRYQRKLNYCLLLRMDAMHGWLENSEDIDGARIELRHKF
jgi:hypothetical protein